MRGTTTTSRTHGRRRRRYTQSVFAKGLLFQATTLFLILTRAGPVLALGKGPVGIYAIDDRYAAVGDSNLNALIIVDLQQGGIVGRRFFPTMKPIARDEAEPARKWASMTGVASCPSCPFAYASTNNGATFWRVDLPKSLAEMGRDRDAGLGDFSALETAPVVPLDFKDRGETRMIALARDGTRGFLCDFDRGVWAFDPYFFVNSSTGKQDEARLLSSKSSSSKASSSSSSSSGKKSKFKPTLFASKRFHFNGEGTAGCTLGSSDAELLVTSPTRVYILEDLSAQRRAKEDPRALSKKEADFASSSSKKKKTSQTAERRENPSFPDTVLRRSVHVSTVCGTPELHIRDAVRGRDGALYVVGHTKGSGEEDAGNVGMAVYRIENYKHCAFVAGQPKKPAGWLDGRGPDARFTRPHEMTTLPGRAKLLLSDIDNRAVRVVDLLDLQHEYGVAKNDTRHHHHKSSDRLLEKKKKTRVEARVSTVVVDEDSFHAFYGDDDVAPLKRVHFPTTLERVPTLTSHRDASRLCERDNRTLCALADLRHAPWPPSDDRVQAAAEVAVWTSHRCNSCWLHFPGMCPEPRPDDSATNRETAAWGFDVYVLARVSFAPNATSPLRLRTECSPIETTRTAVAPVCCDPPSATDVVTTGYDPARSRAPKTAPRGFPLPGVKVG